MGGFAFLIVWGVLVSGLGTLYAFNVGGLLDLMKERVGQTRIMAGRPDGMSPFMTAVFPRVIGGFFIVAGVAAIALGIAFV